MAGCGGRARQRPYLVGSADCGTGRLGCLFSWALKLLPKTDQSAFEAAIRLIQGRLWLHNHVTLLCHCEARSDETISFKNKRLLRYARNESQIRKFKQNIFGETTLFGAELFVTALAAFGYLAKLRFDGA